MNNKQFDIAIILSDALDMANPHGEAKLLFAVRERGSKWSDIAPPRELPKLLLATTLKTESYRLPEFRVNGVFVDVKVYVADEAGLEFDKLIRRMGLFDVNDALAEMVADFMWRRRQK